MTPVERVEPVESPDPTLTGSVSPAQQSPGFFTELFDAVTARTVLLVIGVLLIQLGFVLSYVGAFHRPTPHQIPVAVVAPAQISGHVVTELSGLPGRPLSATAVPSRGAWRLHRRPCGQDRLASRRKRRQRSSVDGRRGRVRTGGEG
jgi:hypothetical protein